MREEIEAALGTVVAPLATAAATAWLSRRFLPVDIARRYALAIPAAAGFFVGYWLLPDWAPLVPEKHWQWLPYLGGAAALGGLTLAAGISWPERLLGYTALSLVAAWVLVPLWPDLQPPRPVAISLLAGYFLLLMASLAALPDRLLGRLFVGLLAVSAGGAGLLVAIGVSFTYAQVAAIAAAALAGCTLAAMFLDGRLPDDRPTAIRGLIPVYAVLVGGSAFVGAIEPSPPLPAILLAPAAPLALWFFAAGPLARLRGIPAVAAQIAAVIVPLMIALCWLLMRRGTSSWDG